MRGQYETEPRWSITLLSLFYHVLLSHGLDPVSWVPAVNSEAFDSEIVEFIGKQWRLQATETIRIFFFFYYKSRAYSILANYENVLQWIRMTSCEFWPLICKSTESVLLKSEPSPHKAPAPHGLNDAHWKFTHQRVNTVPGKSIWKTSCFWKMAIIYSSPSWWLMPWAKINCRSNEQRRLSPLNFISLLSHFNRLSKSHKRNEKNWKVFLDKQSLQRAGWNICIYICVFITYVTVYINIFIAFFSNIFQVIYIFVYYINI